VKEAGFKLPGWAISPMSLLGDFSSTLERQLPSPSIEISSAPARHRQPHINVVLLANSLFLLLCTSSAIMATHIPDKLKAADLMRFIVRAAQLEKVKPVMAYWCM
jgi:hypothetical protein